MLEVLSHPFFLTHGGGRRPLSESQHVDVVDLLWEVHLLLLVGDAEARSGHQTMKYFQVAADAAVHLIGDHALVRHIVLDHDEAVGPQGFLAVPQEVHQVVISQVT